MDYPRRKVLFFAEGATLAHVVRPLALARGLDPSQFDITFCRPSAFRWLTDDANFKIVDLDCQAAATFARRLDYGWPLYSFDTLKRYVEDDLALIDDIRPDVVVGDFRLSLSVSARLRSVPYITICDAYWSPERQLRPPLPVLSFTRFTPLPVAEFLFHCVSEMALRFHAVPLERLRARYGLPSLGYDLRRCYTDADCRLFANFPLLFPDVQASDSAEFIGPVTWFPDTGFRASAFDDSERMIYLTLGSSGNSAMLETIIPALEATGCRVMVATAGKALSFKPESVRTNVFDYLPGNEMCRRAALVVCNGGSPTTNQALANGVPVIGIAQNMDQFLNMRAIEAFGAGLLVRADRLDSVQLGVAAKELMHDPVFGERAQQLAASAVVETGSSILGRRLLSFGV